MILPELSAYLVTAGIGTANVDLFEDYMPPTPDSCVTVTEYGGRSAPDIRVFGQAEMVREYVRVQILVRGPVEDYVTPRVKAQDVVRAMSKIMTTTLSSIPYYSATPLQMPFLLQRDELKRYIFAVNVELFKAISTS